MKQFFKTVFASTFGVLIASGIILLGFIMLVIGLSNEPQYKPEKNTVFKLTLKGELVDQATKNPLADILGESSNQIGLSDIIKSIRYAKENNNIKGIYLEAGGLSGGFASLQTIRTELTNFKESGKFIVAYADNYSQGCYYVCSVADSVFLNPQGAVSLIGLGTQGLFFTGLAEKLGIEINIFKAGTYKSAVEPFMLKKYSEANKEQITSYLGSIWNSITSAIEESRNISNQELSTYLNDGLMIGEATNAIDYKLADKLCYRFEAENIVKEMADQDPDKKLKSASLDKLASVSEWSKPHANKIAILYAEGEIVESKSSSLLDEQEKVITEETAAQLRKLQEDESVKAVVFRVNSPGGSAFVSEQIWKAVVDLKAVKPIVVSMGDYAASGGYYISCAADKIIAEPATLTGSIGVFGIMPNFAGTLEKIGITTDVVTTNPYADLGNSFRPMREEEKTLMQRYVEQTYKLFVGRCANGRGMTPEQIDAIGQGRVWSGEQALSNKLIDELGGIEDAVVAAAGIAELDEYSVVVADAPKDFLTRLMEKKLDEVKLSFVKSFLGTDFALFRTIQQAKTHKGIMTRMPYSITTY